MKFLSALFFTTVSFAYTVANAQPRIAVKTGDKIQLVTNTASTITQTIMGQNMEIVSEVTLNINSDVKENSPNIHLSSVIKRIQLKTEAMGQNINFDSDSKDDMNGQMGEMMKQVVGLSLDGYLSASGKLLPNKTAANSAATNIEALTGGNFDALSFEALVAVPASLKAGDNWTDETNENVDNKKKMVYNVQSVNGNEALVNFTGEESIKKPKNIQGMDATITGTNSYSGSFTVDISSGLIKEKKTTVQGKGETAVMGQNIPFTLSQTIKSNTTK